MKPKIIEIDLLAPISLGGSKTTDYEKLKNKPSINGIELIGNKSTEDLKIYAGYVGKISSINRDGTINVKINDEIITCIDSSPYQLTLNNDVIVIKTEDKNYILSEVDDSITKIKYPVLYKSLFDSNSNILTQTITFNDGTSLSNEVMIDIKCVKSINGKNGEVTLSLDDLNASKVAISGSYDDLINKPTVYSTEIVGDNLSKFFNKITPQLQSTTPDSKNFEFWLDSENYSNDTDLLNETSELSEPIKEENNEILLNDSQEDSLLNNISSDEILLNENESEILLNEPKEETLLNDVEEKDAKILYELEKETLLNDLQEEILLNDEERK